MAMQARDVRIFNLRGTLLLVIVLAAIAALSAYYLTSFKAKSEISDEAREISIASCIKSYVAERAKESPEINNLYQINGFCYSSIGSQLLIDEEIIRKDNFVFQRQENVILLFMVVAITLSGVALAGLQLWASYKLAVAHGAELGGGNEPCLPTRREALVSNPL